MRWKACTGQACETAEQAAEQLEGLTYIYGNTPIECFAFNAFMVKLGMEPLLIQTSQLPNPDDPDPAGHPGTL